MRRRIGRPGLVGTMARTAVVAGTASAVVGGVNRSQQAKAQASAQNTAAQQAAFESQAQLADMQAQVDAMQAQQAAPAPPPAAPAPAPAAAPGGEDVIAKLQQLADLKSAGVLDDAEFAAAKAKLLGV
jgi:Short C-terminal domain